MRTYRFDDLKSLNDLTLHEEPVPTPQRGEVLVKVDCVSLNIATFPSCSAPTSVRSRPG